MVKPADREEPLRRLVTTFITTNLHLLDDGKDINRTIRNGGDFAADAVGILPFLSSPLHSPGQIPQVPQISLRGNADLETS